MVTKQLHMHFDAVCSYEWAKTKYSWHSSGNKCVHEILINNINIIPGQLGKQMERTLSRHCSGLRHVLRLSVFFLF